MAIYTGGMIDLFSYRPSRPRVSPLFILASALLAVEPVLWLIQSWTDAAYASHGYIYFGLIAALVVKSLMSDAPDYFAHDVSRHWALWVAALFRVVSQLMAINVIGGIVLALDIYAIARALQLDRRKFSVSPFWLAILFLFALPVERILQRVTGFPLQSISADLACFGVSPFVSEIDCFDTRIVAQGRDILIDLPCSGTASLMIILALATAMNTVTRPKFTQAIKRMGFALMIAMGVNALRITALALGIVYQSALGIDVMEPFWHDLFGYLALALGIWSLLGLYKPKPSASVTIIKPAQSHPRVAMQNLAGGVMLTLALAIYALPQKPQDISGTVVQPDLPAYLFGSVKTPIPLLEKEKLYFETFGGQSAKARYGAFGVLQTRTTSPLRHLHAPDECLRGLGMDVAFLGTRFTPVRSALYQVEDPDGQRWHVSNFFVAPDGTVTASVAEAIWLWIGGMRGPWLGVQISSPAAMPQAQARAFETALIRALEIKSSKQEQNDDA